MFGSGSHRRDAVDPQHGQPNWVEAAIRRLRSLPSASPQMILRPADMWATIPSPKREQYIQWEDSPALGNASAPRVGRCRQDLEAAANALDGIGQSYRAA